jgi:hypothetical protein
VDDGEAMLLVLMMKFGFEGREEIDEVDEAGKNNAFQIAALILSPLPYLGILLERADGAEALLAQAERLERGALKAQKVPRGQREALRDHLEKKNKTVGKKNDGPSVLSLSILLSLLSVLKKQLSSHARRHPAPRRRPSRSKSRLRPGDDPRLGARLLAALRAAAINGPRFTEIAKAQARGRAPVEHARGVDGARCDSDCR